MLNQLLFTVPTWSSKIKRFPWAILSELKRWTLIVHNCTKKGNGTWCHNYHMKVLRNCFLMIAISYFTKRGNVQTCTNTFTSFHKWQGWNVVKICFLMIPISYFTKKGNVYTCTNTCSTFQKWQWWCLFPHPIQTNINRHKYLALHNFWVFFNIFEVFMLSHWFLVEWARNPRNYSYIPSWEITYFTLKCGDIPSPFPVDSQEY